MKAIALTIYAGDRPGLLRDIAAVVTELGANIESTVHTGGEQLQIHLEVSGLEEVSELTSKMGVIEGVTKTTIHGANTSIFGKRVIVMGGGAQVAQVVLGAVSEADRHNIRGEHISVDTIPLVGEESLAEAIMALGRLPRVSILVLAGSLMGGKITEAVCHIRKEHGIPVISLNMAGSVPSVSDLVVTDPVQAGVMAVMAVASTAKFDLERLRGRRF